MTDGDRSHRQVTIGVHSALECAEGARRIAQAEVDHGEPRVALRPGLRHAQQGVDLGLRFGAGASPGENCGEEPATPLVST